MLAPGIQDRHAAADHLQVLGSVKIISHRSGSHTCFQLHIVQIYIISFTTVGEITHSRRVLLVLLIL